MTTISILLLATIGILLNMNAAVTLLQPDWALALLTGTMLARRTTWRWVLPTLLFHDLALFWSATIFFPLAALIPPVLIYIDGQIGPALPQRMLMLFAVSLPLLGQGWSTMQWLLTLLLAVICWYILVLRFRYEQ